MMVLYRDFVDFKKSINGLSLIVEQQMLPLTGSIYFALKGEISLRSFWGSTGFSLWYKRPEKEIKR
ncbi:MAG: IS66 family insertion sequence element accessory protein TnpB [Alteromonadaceae bacterium]|nr:IS66 family insertion sequence element accessory protein TnpB [Alteromonadaceae bacterium]